MTQPDKEWLEKLDNVIEENAQNHQFSINILAKKMQISRSRLFPKVKRLTGMSPNKYLQITRFNLAKQWLEEGKYLRVKEVAYTIGFKDVKYFSQQFKKRFGRLPSSYLV